MSNPRNIAAAAVSVLLLAGCTAAPTPTPAPTAPSTPTVTPSTPQSAVAVSFKCEEVPADVLALAKTLVHTETGAEPEGAGALVWGDLTPGGHRWQIIAVNTRKGPKVVLRTLPASGTEHLDDGRVSGEFVPLSDTWNGDLAQLRGHLENGPRVRDAALECLG